MGDFSGIGGQRFEAGGPDLTDTTGPTITPSTSTNTKGSYIEIIASTTFDTKELFIITARGNSAIDYLYDIAIGAAGSEKDIISNLYHTSTGRYLTRHAFPLAIPAGTRISARSQALGASKAGFEVLVYMTATGYTHPNPLGRCTTYGAATGDSGGTSIDPGASANTKGAYSELTASSTNPTKSLAIGIGNQANSVRSNALYLLDIAVGASGSERVILGDIWLVCGTQIDIVAPSAIPSIPVNIPAGTRISARAQCDITDVTDRLFDVIVYGAD
ncbi:hypothetical protein LCGC14_2404330 [marine sediment metagenome]|uniref:Uncharacterized protein n=1 Tax=marine sediment metagenome TaxID=412755 RepID=A0A0F9BUK3_9ZZZZ